MPKATTKSVHVAQEEFNQPQDYSENESPEEFNTSQVSNSDDEVVLKSQPSTSQSQANQQVYMPYIEGPKMDWAVNDTLYDKFLKWKLKCKNILKCELAILLETRKCKKVIARSGDFGLDQNISWNLSNEELCLDTIWQTFEEFCKPQTNELRARFDLLTSF